MSDPKSIGPGCNEIVGVHEGGSWDGWPIQCGSYPATKRREAMRYDDMICDRHHHHYDDTTTIIEHDGTGNEHFHFSLNAPLGPPCTADDCLAAAPDDSPLPVDDCLAAAPDDSPLPVDVAGEEATPKPLPVACMEATMKPMPPGLKPEHIEWCREWVEHEIDRYEKMCLDQDPPKEEQARACRVVKRLLLGGGCVITELDPSVVRVLPEVDTCA